MMSLQIMKTAYSKINNLLYMSYLPNILNAAIDLGVFERLSKGAMSLSNLSEQLCSNESVTEALLDVLVATDFLTKEDFLYKLTALSDEFLTEDSDISQLGAIKSFRSKDGLFVNLLQALKGNMPDFDPSMWSTEESIREIEQGAKVGALQHVSAFVKELPEFKTANKMCDFAGNSGYYSYALLKENKSMEAHVYDLDGVCKIASKIKKDEDDFNRVFYHAFDLRNNDDFGGEYDLFFSSHFLYKYNTKDLLTNLLKKVNKSMKMGGLFISSHIGGQVHGDHDLTLRIIELMTRSMGFPTHTLAENKLRKALSEAGFGRFRVKVPDERLAFPTVVLSAVKMKDIVSNDNT